MFHFCSLLDGISSGLKMQKLIAILILTSVNFLKNVTLINWFCFYLLSFSFSFSAVMQTDGFEYLKESCPSVLTELLEYVARVNEHSVIECRHGNEAILDGSDINGRRVKQRL